MLVWVAVWTGAETVKGGKVAKGRVMPGTVTTVVAAGTGLPRTDMVNTMVAARAVMMNLTKVIFGVVGGCS